MMNLYEEIHGPRRETGWKSLGATFADKMNKLIWRPVRAAELNEITFELSSRINDLLRDGLDVVVEADAAVIGEHVKEEHAHMAGLGL